MIRHLVTLKFAATTTEEERQSIMDDLAALQPRIDGFLDFQVRRNISPETPVVRGFLDMFWVDFADEAARDAYLEDSEHKKAGARLVASLEGGVDGLFVYDFEA